MGAGIKTDDTEVPLVVDLDGTLVKTDTLIEMIMMWVKRYPLKPYLLVWWLKRGKAYVKRRVAGDLDLEEVNWPYHAEVRKYLEEQYARGRPIFLATASDQRVAEAVSRRLKIFERVWGSDGKQNLSGEIKADWLAHKFGERKFDYMGDARRDLLVWAKSRRALVVSDSKRLREKVKQVAEVEKMWSRYGKERIQVCQLIRCRQWVKNVLLLGPAFAAQQLMQWEVLRQAGLAVVAFSLMASSIYVVNDLFDIPVDRKHISKKQRPLAAGTINIWWAVVLVPVLMGAAWSVAWWLPVGFTWLLGFYLGLNLMYTWRIKQIVGWDVLVLVGLYSLRIYAGGVVTGIEVSVWLMVFGVTVFLSLALVKRYAELLMMEDLGQKRLGGRGYRLDHKRAVHWWGVASGYVSVVVLAWYVLSGEAERLYANTEYLWMGVVVWWYWMNRVWGMANRRELDEDPAVWAVRDRVSRVAAMLLIGLILLAR